MYANGFIYASVSTDVITHFMQCVSHTHTHTHGFIIMGILNVNLESKNGNQMGKFALVLS